MTPQQKRDQFLATFKEKEAEAHALMAQTEKIVSELIRARRKKAPADPAAEERLSITEAVMAELIAEGRDELSAMMAKSLEDVKKHLGDFS